MPQRPLHQQALHARRSTGSERYPDELPDHGLDKDGTAVIMPANAPDVDALVTDDFRNLVRIRALPEDIQLVPRP
ncbi:hypothetical protein [Halorhabdus rudnickae]|uniref:hypothetical protein n=1 Tax=Halorhabdus rudnickae TaxID=1775544 RepID=UPI00108490EF|nr:hypothetical protein [Halorhabdus rudnickae]